MSTGIRYGADFVGYGPDKPLYTTLGARLVRLDAGNTPVPLRLLVGVQDAKKTTLPLISTDPRPNSYIARADNSGRSFLPPIGDGQQFWLRPFPLYAFCNGVTRLLSS